MSQHGKKRGPGQDPEATDNTTNIVDIETAGTKTTNQSDPPETASAEPTPKTESPADKATEYWDRLVRTTADFENFRKRAVRERQEALSYANESLLKQLLSVLESFDKALTAASDSKETSVESLQTGVNLILQQFTNVLTEAGISEIDTTNQPFDPNWHEAISQQESADVPDGQILLQVRKGYKLRDRLLRPALVIVATNPPEKPKA